MAKIMIVDAAFMRITIKNMLRKAPMKLWARLKPAKVVERYKF